MIQGTAANVWQSVGRAELDPTGGVNITWTDSVPLSGYGSVEYLATLALAKSTVATLLNSGNLGGTGTWTVVLSGASNGAHEPPGQNSGYNDESLTISIQRSSV